MCVNVWKSCASASECLHLQLADAKTGNIASAMLNLCTFSYSEGA